jgi:transposase
MSLEKIRKMRDKIHKFSTRDSDLHGPLNNLLRSVEKLFSDGKEMEDARLAAKHAKNRSEHKEQYDRYKNAKKSERENLYRVKKAFRKFKEKWRRLRRSAI